MPVRVGYVALAGVVVATLVIDAAGADSLHGGALRSTVPHHH